MRWHSGLGACGMLSERSLSRNRRNSRRCSTSMDIAKPSTVTCWFPGDQWASSAGKFLGCRELVVLHEQQGDPRLSTTHRGDQHLTHWTPAVLRPSVPAADLGHLDGLV